MREERIISLSGMKSKLELGVRKWSRDPRGTLLAVFLQAHISSHSLYNPVPPAQVDQIPLHQLTIWINAQVWERKFLSLCSLFPCVLICIKLIKTIQQGLFGTLLKDLILVPRTHVGYFTAYNASCIMNPVFSSLLSSTNIENIHTYTNKINLYKKKCTLIQMENIYFTPFLP